jgi:hypothetical protein
MLNKFADSQPALRYPNEPAGSSNPKLGDALAAALAAADSENATGTLYTPTTAPDWSPAPTPVQGALDQSGARLTATEAATTAAQGDATQALTDASTAQSTAEDAENQAYTANGADWTDADPTTLKQAVDRLATAVAGLLVGTIP